MNSFQADRFFDLTDFEHRDLFSNEQPVWAHLGHHLKEFLELYFSKKPSQILGTVEEGAHIESKSVYIAEGAIVEAGAYIKGPTIIGAGTEVRHGAYVRGHVITGKNCVIGHATEIKGSIMLNGAKAGHFNYIGDSILGNECNLGAGTKLANLKVQPGNVFVKHGSERIDSGLRKFGSILGDGFQSGCNSVTNPGFVAAKESIVYPCVSAQGAHTEAIQIK